MSNILPEELTTFQYYVDKLPTYLKNDDAFLTHFKIWFDFLVGEENNLNDGLIGAGEQLLSLINIFGLNTGDKTEEEKTNEYLALLDSLGNGSDLLDKLGSIFNIRRKFSVVYKNEDDIEISHNIELDNKDFLIFIKAQIIKNYSDGTYQQMREFYDKAGLSIYFKSDNPANASTRVYLLDLGLGSTNYSDNIKHLFLAGLLTIESMGITYNYSIQSYEKMLVWDKEITQDYLGWDYGEWTL